MKLTVEALVAQRLAHQPQLWGSRKGLKYCLGTAKCHKVPPDVQSTWKYIVIERENSEPPYRGVP